MESREDKSEDVDSGANLHLKVTAEEAAKLAALPVEEYKIVCVGAGAVGKTSLLRYAQKKGFPNEYIPTVGAEVSTVPNGTGRIRVVHKDGTTNDEISVLRYLYQHTVVQTTFPFFAGSNTEVPHKLWNNHIEYMGYGRSRIT